MKAGTGVRAAALLTAGLVAFAVMAPGIASAETTPSVPDCTSGQVLDASGTACVPADHGSTSAGSASGSGSSGTGSGSGSTSTDPATTAEQAPATSGGTTGSSGAGGSSAATSPGQGTAPGGTVTERSTPAAVGDSAPRATDPPATVSKALTGLTGTDATGATLGDVLGSLPTGNLAGLGDIPQPTDGQFADAQDACLYLASKVNAPPGSEAALGEQFSQFCGALPSTSTASLTDLVTALTELLKGLRATPTHPGSTSTEPVHAAWGDLPGRFRDLDCAQLSYDEAQAVLHADPSDPNRLDGDHDGIACERNARDYAKVCDDYVGYPVGGVATGDSAPVVEPDLAAALAGLALATVAGATMTRREDTETTDADTDVDRSDLLTAGER